MGDFDVQTSSGGIAEFTNVLATTVVQPGMFLTMTATKPIGGFTSELSPPTLIQGNVHSDADGMSDAVEAQSPGRGNGSIHPQRALPGDGNGDGIADSEQANVTSLPGITGEWITLEVANGLALQNVTPSGPPDFASLPSGYSFPFGFVSFTVSGLPPGGSVTVTNIFHDAFEFKTVFAYGPTPDNPQPHWYELTPEFGTDELHLTFTDGAAGDHDLVANGSVTTIYAPAYKLPPGPQLTLLSHESETVELLGISDSTNGFILTTNSVTLVTCALGWPADASNCVLQVPDNLSPTNLWSTLFDEPVLIANQLVLTNASVDPMRFYRLHVFDFPAIAPAAPILNIQPTSTNTFLLSWPSSFTEFALQQNTNLATGDWAGVTNPVNVTNGQNQVLVAPATGSRFFRLSSP